MIEKLTKQLIDELKKAGLTQHCAYDPLLWLYHDLLEQGREKDQDKLLHYLMGEPGPYVDMAKAEALYRRWCRTNGVKRASMSRNAKVLHGHKQDAPCLVFVAGKLKLPTYVVERAWRSRKKLTP